MPTSLWPHNHKKYGRSLKLKKIPTSPPLLSKPEKIPTLENHRKATEASISVITSQTLGILPTARASVSRSWCV